MKKLTLFFVSVYAATLGGLMAVDPDFVKGVDFTGVTSVTGAKLNQLVDNGYVGGNRGMIIYTSSLEYSNVVSEPKLARYLWLDTNYNPPVPKVYNTNTHVWTNITATALISDNSITRSKVASGAIAMTNILDNAVVAAKIPDAEITGAKIAGTTITAANIVSGTITSTQIATNGIATANLADASVIASKLSSGSVGISNLQSGFLLYGSNVAPATITSNNVLGAGLSYTNIGIGSATSNQVLRVNSGGTALEFGSPVSIFRSTNMVITSGTALIVSAYNHGLGALPDNYNVYLVNRANNASLGYTVGDVIPMSCIVGNGAIPCLSVSATSSTFTLYKENASHYIPAKTTGAATAVSDANLATDWYVYIVATRFNQ